MDNLSSISYEEGWQDAATPVRYEHVERTEEPKEEVRKEKKPRSFPLVLIVQLALCLILVLSAYAVKLIGGDLYKSIHSWYVTQLNDEIIMTSDFEHYSLKSLIDEISH